MSQLIAELVQKAEASRGVLDVLQDLQREGAVVKWGKALDGRFTRRSVAIYELKSVGIQDPEQIAKPSTRNDMAFLASVLGVSSILGVLALQLPGELAAFLLAAF
jgi:hypothetical protein